MISPFESNHINVNNAFHQRIRITNMKEGVQPIAAFVRSHYIRDIYGREILKIFRISSPHSKYSMDLAIHWAPMAVL